MDATDTEEFSDADSAGGGDVRNRSLSMSESHCSDFSDVDNTDSRDVSDSQSTPLGSDPLAQLLATPEHAGIVWITSIISCQWCEPHECLERVLGPQDVKPANPLQ